MENTAATARAAIYRAAVRHLDAKGRNQFAAAKAAATRAAKKAAQAVEPAAARAGKAAQKAAEKAAKTAAAEAKALEKAAAKVAAQQAAYARLEAQGLRVQSAAGRVTLAGDTFRHKEAIKTAGGKWDGYAKAWTMSEKQAAKLAARFAPAELPPPMPLPEPPVSALPTAPIPSNP